MEDAVRLMLLALQPAQFLAACQLALHLISRPADASVSDAIKAGITMKVVWYISMSFASAYVVLPSLMLST